MNDPRHRLPQRTRITLTWWGFHATVVLALVLYALRA
jgi:hypothetical protein